MTDPRRFNIPITDAVTPGEQWDFAVTVTEEQEDGSFEEAQSFGSYDGWTFYILETLATPHDRAYVTLTTADGIAVGTPPYLTVTVAADQTAHVPAKPGIAYEIWAEINGAPKRLRYGTLQVIN